MFILVCCLVTLGAGAAAAGASADEGEPHTKCESAPVTESLPKEPARVGEYQVQPLKDEEFKTILEPPGAAEPRAQALETPSGLLRVHPYEPNHLLGVENGFPYDTNGSFSGFISTGGRWDESAGFGNGFPREFDFPKGTDAFSLYIGFPSGSDFVYPALDPEEDSYASVTSSDGVLAGMIAPRTWRGFHYFSCSNPKGLESITIRANTPIVIGNVAVGGTQYVALGDSFSSGEGNPPFVQADGTTPAPKGDHCDRSTQAYPEVLWKGQLKKLSFRFPACSGARSPEVRNQQGDLSPATRWSR